MLKLWIDKRGITLFIVLGTLLLVVVLANIILTIMLSHSRLTHHQVSRIQAYYAAMAGVNYALEKIRLNNDPAWIPELQVPPQTTPVTRTLCKSGCDVTESAFPNSIQRVTITIGAPGSGISRTRLVSAKATYTYIPPSSP